MNYQRHTLSNGVRLIHRHSSSHVAHCGLVINAGSRDEDSHEHGLAHFIEHVIFKGTTRRKAFHVLSLMENVGGEINAYTTKEETCIYGSFMTAYYKRWFDLVSDIVFRSTFPARELEKEKDIILDEINSYKDSPAEQIYDDFDEIVFDSHPLGVNILGTPEHLRTFSRQSVYDFMDRYYATDQMVLCSVGNIPLHKLIQMAEQFFGQFPARTGNKNRIPVSTYQPLQKWEARKNHQAHCIIGNQAYGLLDRKKTPLLLLNNILGGPGLNSRLNLSVREKHGFCYHIESTYQAFTDTGIFNIYFGTDAAYVDKTLGLIHKELNRLRDVRLGALQLKRAKQQLTGQVAISFESNVNEMLSMGKSMVHFDDVDTMEDINRKIDAVTPEDLLEVANEVLHPDAMSMLVYKP